MCSNTNSAIFLDRDGTIIEDRGHLRDPSEAVFFPETFEALRKLQEHFTYSSSPIREASPRAGLPGGMLTALTVVLFPRFLTEGSKFRTSILVHIGVRITAAV